MVVNVVSSQTERIEKVFGNLKHFKILAAKDKAVFGRCASVSRYVKKYCNIMILT